MQLLQLAAAAVFEKCRSPSWRCFDPIPEAPGLVRTCLELDYQNILRDESTTSFKTLRIHGQCQPKDAHHMSITCPSHVGPHQTSTRLATATSKSSESRGKPASTPNMRTLKATQYVSLTAKNALWKKTLEDTTTRDWSTSNLSLQQHCSATAPGTCPKFRGLYS